MGKRRLLPQAICAPPCLPDPVLGDGRFKWRASSAIQVTYKYNPREGCALTGRRRSETTATEFQYLEGNAIHRRAWPSATQ